eukprot:Awhi_evm2s15107
MTFLPDRSVQGTEIYANVSVTNEFLSYRRGFLIELIILDILVVIFFLFILRVSHVEIVQKKKQGKKLVFFLLLSNLFIAAVHFTNNLILVLVPISSKICSFYSLGAAIYMSQMVTTYLLFLERAEKVNVAKSKFYLLFCKLVKIAVYTIPVMIVLGFFFTHGLLYFKEQICIENSVLWLLILFTLLNVTLTLALLFIFLYPLRRLVKFEQKSSNTKRFTSMARLNLFCGLFSVLSTTTFIAVATWASLAGNTIETAHLNWLYFICPVADMFVNSVCCLSITHNVWLPTWVKNKLSSFTSYKTSRSRSSSNNYSQGSKKHCSISTRDLKEKQFSNANCAIVNSESKKCSTEDYTGSSEILNESRTTIPTTHEEFDINIECEFENTKSKQSIVSLNIDC